jgi:hypothetical protein
VNGSRHIEIFECLPDGTRVPEANSSNDCDRHHTRTIGSKGRIRKNWRVSLCATGQSEPKAGVPWKGFKL